MNSKLRIPLCWKEALSSSDLSFDLQLTGIPAVPQTLYAARFGADLVLYWGDPAYRLESADTVTGPWQTVPGATSPVVGPFAGPQKFYRLHR